MVQTAPLRPVWMKAFRPHARPTYQEGTIETTRSFGQWLRQRRETLDLTREELANRINCAAETIRKWEREERRPSKQLAERLATELKLEDTERHTFVQQARQKPLYMRPAPAPLSTLSHAQRLPVPLTHLIGREADMQALHVLLRRRDVRLLTLLGPPGVGKTHLGLQLAADVSPLFADGVAWLPLASHTDPRHLIAALAQEWGLKGGPGQALLEVVQSFLYSKQMLLVLDNCEQVLSIAGVLTELLQAAPRVKVLATSRAPFHIRGEQEWPLAPLALPPLTPLPALTTLGDYPAIQLFMSRAQAVKPDLQLSPSNAQAIAEICVRLDGLPLALELAAVRTKVFTPSALLNRLQNRLTILVGQSRDQAARQQTLRAAIGVSYELLSDHERVVFELVSVFRGGWTVEAAGRLVTSVTGTTVDALAIVTALVDQSLVRLVEQVAGEPRFGMLETIREYAGERLSARGYEDLVGQHHAQYFLAVAEEAEPELAKAQLKQWGDRLEADHDDFRTALGWLLERGQVEQTGRLVAALWQFWETRAYLTEGLQWMTAVLERQDQLSLPVRADVLNAKGRLLHTQGAVAQATACFKENLAIRRQIGDLRRVGYALNDVGLLLAMGQDTAGGVAMLEEALTLFRTQKDQAGMADVLLNLGAVRMWGPRELDGAITALEEAVVCFQAVSNPRGIMAATGALGMSYYFRGDVARAVPAMHMSLALARQLDDKIACVHMVLVVGTLLIDQGQSKHGLRLIAAAEARREQLGLNAIPLFDINQKLALARSQLQRSTYEETWQEGQTLLLNEVVEIALDRLLVGFVASD